MTEDDTTYDEALRRLEDLVVQLERGGKTSTKRLAMFEEGSALLQAMPKRTGEVEGRLAELRLDEAEALVKDEAEARPWDESTSPSSAVLLACWALGKTRTIHAPIPN